MSRLSARSSQFASKPSFPLPASMKAQNLKDINSSRQTYINVLKWPCLLGRKSTLVPRWIWLGPLLWRDLFASPACLLGACLLETTPTPSNTLAGEHRRSRLFSLNDISLKRSLLALFLAQKKGRLLTTPGMPIFETQQTATNWYRRNQKL